MAERAAASPGKCERWRFDLPAALLSHLAARVTYGAGGNRVIGSVTFTTTPEHTTHMTAVRLVRRSHWEQR